MSYVITAAPPANHQVLNQDGTMNEAWYRFFQTMLASIQTQINTMETQISDIEDDIDALDVRVTALEP